MKKRNPWLMVLIAILVLASASIACGPDPDDPDNTYILPAAVRGGGGLRSGNSKVTFGFQLTCDKATGEVGGQFQYVDRDAPGEDGRVAFHGVVNMLAPECKVSVTQAGDPGSHQGTYRPQPGNLGAGGDLDIKVIGQKPDYCLEVSLFEGVYDGYTRTVCPNFGSIRVWE